MSPVYWTSTYIIINGINLALLIYERRPVNLTSDQERMRTLLFRAFSPREFLRFVRPADWRAGRPDERLIAKDTTPDGLMAILYGEAIVRVEGKEITRLRMGQFVGEISFISGQFASADVFAGDDLRYVFWSRDTLTQLFSRYPHYQNILNAILGTDMAGKLNRTAGSDGTGKQTLGKWQ